MESDSRFTRVEVRKKHNSDWLCPVAVPPPHKQTCLTDSHTVLSLSSDGPYQSAWWPLVSH